jgi:LPXTG-site transpeptidase (sortase) family protein
MMAVRPKYLRLSLAGLLVLAIIALFLALRGFGGDDADDQSEAGPAAVSTTVPSLSEAVPVDGVATPSQAPLARLVIPRIDVDAPISVKNLGPDGGMDAPDGPEDVAWYQFTNRPGEGSNAVFSAHVDYRNYGPAVFAHLEDLKKGDAVEVHLADGTVYRYQVVVTVSYPAETAPSEDIVGPTSREVITLITCAGTFDQASRQYSHRLVVRAERV